MADKRLAKQIGAGAAALLIATVALFEGKVNDPHWDRFAKIWDVCYGETTVQMRRYSDAECKAMLEDRLADYAGPVLATNPELKGHDNQLVAAISLSYNIGNANYRRSTVSRKFRAGDWKGACNAFLAWNRAGGQVVRGLTRRRETERALCLRGLS